MNFYIESAIPVVAALASFVAASLAALAFAEWVTHRTPERTS